MFTLDAGRMAFSVLVGVMAPYSASIDPFVHALAPGAATVSITQRCVYSCESDC